MNTLPIITKLAAIVYVAPGTGTPIHTQRPYHGIVYYPKKSSRFQFRDGTVLDSENSCILYLPKNASYQVTSTYGNGEGCYVFNFDSDLPPTLPFCQTFRSDTAVRNLFQNAWCLWKEKRLAYEERCLAFLYEIFAYLRIESQSEYAMVSKQDRLTAAMDHIHENYLTEQINVADLAALCKMSETYFRRLFQGIYHRSPLQYINGLKIRHAKELMESGLYDTISEIALLSGFHDDCYFRKIFKQTTHMTPKEYKKR